MGFAILMLYFCAVRILSLKINSKKVELFLYFLGLFFFVGFRSVDTGSDTVRYLASYSLFPPITEGLTSQISINSIEELLYSIFLGSGREIGYAIFVQTLRCFFSNPQVLLISEALVVSICYAWFFYHCVDDYFIGILALSTFGILTFLITGVRQSFAMAFCVLAYTCFSRKKYLFGVLWTIIGVTFHRSALLFGVAEIPVILFKNRLKIKGFGKLFIVLVLGAVACYMIPRLMVFLSMMVEDWAGYNEVESTGNGIVFVTIAFIITVLLENYYRRIEQIIASPKFNMRNEYLWFIGWMTRLVTRTTERVILFFLPSVILFLGNITPVMKDSKNYKFIRTGIIVFIIALYLYRTSRIYYSLCF